jgi:hypothetical protein
VLEVTHSSGIFGNFLIRSRGFWGGVIAGSTIFSPFFNAYASDFNQYVNERYHTRLEYPSDWKAMSSELSGGRSLEAFVDPVDSDTSVSVAYTAIPGDFTKLSSFGDLKSYLLPKGESVTTSLLSENTKGNAYSIEYTISVPGSPTRHVKSVFGLRPQESVVGLTIQTREDKYTSLKKTFDDISTSFSFDSDSSSK